MQINLEPTSRLSSFNLSPESSILLASIKSAYFSVNKERENNKFNNQTKNKKSK